MASQTLRLPDLLKDRAANYAESLGISFTALVAVALKDYLDSRDGQSRVQAEPPPEPPAVSPPQPTASAAQVNRAINTIRQREKVGRNDPCPCGSGRKFKLCCGR